MQQRELKRLFRRIVLASVPVPVGAALSACAGQTDIGSGSGTGGFFPGTRVMLGGTSSAGGSSSTSTSSKGLGGFLGTVVMVGGNTSTSPSSQPNGVGGFLGTVVMVGGTTSSNTVQTVTCPDAVPNNTGGSASILSCPAFCVVTDAAAGTLDSAACTSLCGRPALGCELLASTGPSLLKCHPGCTGRRPDGLARMQTSDCDELGRYFTEVAHLEAASVAAFRALGRELAVYGAPRSLRRAVRRAARDEVRHARLTRDLALRFGGRYVPPDVTAKPAPSLETIARENATEGCVRETYGALVATYQAQAAADPQVRSAMTQIARDETRHAAIAWRIARWAEGQLDAGAKLRVRQARQSAVDTLLGELNYESATSLEQTAGVPTAALARRMASRLSSELWA